MFDLSCYGNSTFGGEEYLGMAKFIGTFKDLVDIVEPLELRGRWLEHPNHVWKFRCDDGACILWSQTRRTLWFDGPLAARVRLERAVVSLLTCARRLTASERGVQLPAETRPAGRLQTELPL